MKRDYSEYLTPTRLAVEEQLWASERLYMKYVELVRQALTLSGAETVIEIGCGTGWIPTQLPAGRELYYMGVDKNFDCLELAKAKNAPERRWLKRDIRHLENFAALDLVFSFAVLKHFALHEWDKIFTKILGYGRWAVFTIPVHDAADQDDGVEFPHVTLSRQHVEQAIQHAGHEMVRSGTLGGTDYENWYITRLGGAR